ncbi:MAG: SOS response-associated peptidase [Bacteroidales bacterium]|nr:SOS response-associated peptidase [Bacteroidales bacterium]
MCFYYTIKKKPATKLVKNKIITNEQLQFINEVSFVNGFEHPKMPVIIKQDNNEVEYANWGFLPTSVMEVQDTSSFTDKYNTLNAKAETIETSTLYAQAFKLQRCLIPASGFFEWRHINKERIPYYISTTDDELFVFAGIYNHSIDAHGATAHSFAIVTTPANTLMEEIHNTKKRMPLILPSHEAALWLDAKQETAKLQSLIKPFESNLLKAHSVRKFSPAAILDINSIAEPYKYQHIPNLFEKPNTLF